MYSQEVKYGPRLMMTLCYVSSEDEAHPVEALQTQSHISIGWQSGKHCRYPQELGFRFEGQVTLDYIRLLSHERKISSCVDVFTADATPEEVQKGVCAPYAQASFTRLGHVRFSSNEKNSYNARELKTVGIRKSCTYLKLVFRRPHHNSYNIFQQVGVVAISAHGNLVRHFTAWSDNMRSVVVGEVTEAPMDEMLPLTLEEAGTKAARLTGSASASAERRVRELNALKARAVAEEDYDLADALKKQITVVEQSRGQIKQLEEQKAQAVAAEDYQKAKMLKQRIEALYSAAFNPGALPGPAAGGGAAELPKSAPPSTSPPRVAEDSAGYAPRVFPSTAHDDIVVGGKGYYDLNDAKGIGDGAASALPVEQEVPVAGGGAEWEKRFNKIIAKHSGEHGAPVQLVGEVASESKLYERDLGVYCAACMLGKKGQLREAAIRSIMSDEGVKLLQEHTSEAVELLFAYLSSKGRGFTDPFPGVVIASCEATDRLASGALPAPLAQFTGSLVKVLPLVVARLGDANSRIRESVEGTVIAIARSQMGPDRVVALLIADPDKQNKKPCSYRTHVSRIDILSTFVDDWGTNRGKNPNALDTAVIVHQVLLPALLHSNGEVREAAAKLYAKLVVLDPKVSTPPMEGMKPATRGVVEQRVEELRGAREDKAAAAVPQGPDLETDSQSIQSSTPSTTSDIQNLLQLAEQLTAQRGKAAKQPEAKLESLKAATTHDSTTSGTSSTSSFGRKSLRTCQFCGEYNDHFDETRLDLHYVRECPMLCPCPLCDQVTEISTLQFHLVRECEGHELVRECPRCREAIRAEDLKKHMAARNCIEYTPSHSVCPLCHARFKAGLDGWRQHLTVSPGCPNNPRRFDGTGASN